MNKDWIGSTQGICIDGVNSAVRPDLIGQAQLAWGFNLTVRDGKPRTRPRLIERLVLPEGRVQGAGFFGRAGVGVLSIGGYIYRLNISGPSFSSEMIPLSFQNNPNLETAWMVETAGSFLIQDGQSDCIIYDGATARRSDPSIREVPIGRMMAYGNGRLWVARNDYTLQAGDITQPDVAGSELFFIENVYLFGGGSFSYPQQITGLSFLPSNNTFSGYGSLVVMGRRFTDSIRAEITDRDLWQTTAGFQVKVLEGIGCASHLSITRVNQDLYWRDADGEVRSLRAAAADQDGPGNSSLSREISRIVDFETDPLMEQSSGMYFDNRLFFSASPYLGEDGVVIFRKIISLDCAPLATMRGKSAPAYDGEWEGLNLVRMFQGNFSGTRRAFMISSDPDGLNRLWEIVPGKRDDVYVENIVDGETVTRPIECFAEFRRFDFGKPSQLKQITRCDIYPSEIEDSVNIRLQWRTDSRTQWIEVDDVDICAKMTDDSTDSPHVWKNLASQERGRVKSFSFPQDIDPVLSMKQSVGFSFQIRIVWTGNVLIDRIDVWGRELESPQYSNITQLPEGCPENDVQGNEITYTILPTGGFERVTEDDITRVTEDDETRVTGG